MSKKKLTARETMLYILAGVLVGLGVIGAAGLMATRNNDPRVGSTPAADDAQVLVEDDLVRISYKGSGTMEGVAGTAYVYFEVENLSDQAYTVYPMNSSVNDTVVLLTSGVPASVVPGKTYTYPWSVYYQGVGIQEYADLESLETEFQLMAEDGAVLETVGPFAVEFTQQQ
ncbi:hypothetical protein B5E80_15210 [Flavonifractor sp. An135]|nr:hypothetical protein [Flavonifractor sp. An135]OUQ22145.1 hypothetical protein B5E80_15210 [Flavonifractor sp. An135]